MAPEAAQGQLLSGATEYDRRFFPWLAPRLAEGQSG